MPDIEALQSNIDTAYHLGFLKAQLTVAPYAELGPVKRGGDAAGVK